MATNNYFRVNSPKVTHETLDGEVVIINLDTGSYYSMNATGAAIWNLLDVGMPVEQVIATLSQRYLGDPQEVTAGVRTLIEKLQEENLMVVDEGTTIAATNGAVPKALNETTLPPFEFPILQKYTDMEDLLLLDPIHEVDDTGWPNKN
jgi:hypothetical protein